MPELCIIPARILRDPEINYTRLRAALAVGHFTARDGSGVWASNATLADVAGIDERELRRALQWLVARGHVRKQERTAKTGGTITNMLAIVLDDPMAVAEGGEGEIPPPGGRGKSPHPPRVKVPHPGRGKSPLQSTQLNEEGNELPTPAPADAEPEGVGLEAEFDDPVHRETYLALRRAHRFPVAFDATLRKLRTPITGGAVHTWGEIGAALLSQAGNGETFNELRVRGYLRTAREASVAPPRTNARPAADPAATGVGVPIGGRTWSVPALWDAFVRGGFTAPMQSREVLGERVQALLRDGAIADADAFLALVLHVRPWVLAEIKFARTREERLLELLATFHAPAQGAA